MAQPRNRDRGGVLLGIVLLLLAAGGILIALRALQPDPWAVRAEFKARWEAVERDFADDPERLDVAIEDLLAEPRYRVYGQPFRSVLKEEHPVIHSSAIREREARREIAPFLARCADLSRLPDDELDPLYEEARALLCRYDHSRVAEDLRTRLEGLRARLNEASRFDRPVSIARLLQSLREKAREDQFAMAREALDEFAREPAAGSDPELAGILQHLRETVASSAEARAERILARAHELAASGKEDEALRLLEAALPGLRGFALSGSLEAQAQGLRRKPLPIQPEVPSRSAPR